MKMKKILALSIACVCGVSTFAGCGGQPAGQEYDEATTTVIRVSNYDCGYGRTYIEKVAEKFMTAVKDTEYETGKKGVFIDIAHSQTDTTGQAVLNTLDNTDKEIFFTTSVTPNMAKTSGKVMDLKEIISATSADENYPYAEETSIKDRMYSDFKNYYVEESGSAYTLPLFMGSYNFYYDAELMASKKLYVSKDSTDEKVYLTGEKSEFNAGPDGKTGTEDDGFPQTYAQFYLWCTEMKEDKSVTPLTYSGQFNQHMTFALNSLIADFEGKEAYKMLYTLKGEDVEGLVKEVDSDGNVLSYYDPMDITAENGYMLTRKEGVLQAVRFAKTMATNHSKWIDSLSFSQSQSHTGAQSTYILSKYTNNKILMFTDGGYWEAEAKSVFDQCESRNGGKMDRQFKLLPLPKATRAKVGTEDAPARTTVGVTGELELFVKKDVEASKLQAIKDFITFFHTEENMALENVESGVPRPFNYTIGDNMKAQMSTYNFSLYNTLHGENVDVVFKGSTEPMYLANTTEFNHYNWPLKTLYKTDKSDYRVLNFFYEQDRLQTDVDVKGYFNGIYNYTQYSAKAGGTTNWQAMYNKIQG